jgi:hypothetical protein
MSRFCAVSTLSALILLAGCTPEHRAATTNPADPEAGFVSIFNGQNLDGWTYGMTPAGRFNKAGEGYKVDADRHVIYCTEKDGGNLYTQKEYADFVLHFEFKLTANANNGIGIRAPLEGNGAYNGMEIQVLDDSGDKYTHLRPEQYHGSIYDLVAAERGHQKPVGEWNTEEIAADGRHVKVVLNGTTIVDANLDDIKDPAKLAKHPGLWRTTGHIGFLGHGAAVEFRNLRVKEL